MLTEILQCFTTPFIKVLIIFIIFDCIFGVLRAIKEHKINSTIGINGIIRKIGMIFSVILCVLIDYFVKFNLVAFLPEAIREAIHIEKIGTTEFFIILYSVFEILSIFKNMIKCNLPIPKKLQQFLNKILEEYTEETKSKKGE